MTWVLLLGATFFGLVVLAWILALFVLSLAVRVFAWIWMVLRGSDTPPSASNPHEWAGEPR